MAGCSDAAVLPRLGGLLVLLLDCQRKDSHCQRASEITYTSSVGAWEGYNESRRCVSGGTYHTMQVIPCYACGKMDITLSSYGKRWFLAEQHYGILPHTTGGYVGAQRMA